MWLRRGQRISAFLNGQGEIDADLALWQPGTRALQRRFPGARTRPVRRGIGFGFTKRLRPYRAASTGWYYLEVKQSAAGSGPYALTLRR
jgi:hypothetical protein